MSGYCLIAIAFLVWGKHGRKIVAADLRPHPNALLVFAAGFGLALVAHVVGT